MSVLFFSCTNVSETKEKQNIQKWISETEQAIKKGDAQTNEAFLKKFSSSDRYKFLALLHKIQHRQLSGVFLTKDNQAYYISSLSAISRFLGVFPLNPKEDRVYFRDSNRFRFPVVNLEATKTRNLSLVYEPAYVKGQFVEYTELSDLLKDIEEQLKSPSNSLSNSKYYIIGGVAGCAIIIGIGLYFYNKTQAAKNKEDIKT